MKGTTISIAVIAKNEVDRIGRLLKSPTFTNEVVVVNSRSTDGMQDLCQKMGEKLCLTNGRDALHEKLDVDGKVESLQKPILQNFYHGMLFLNIPKPGR